VTVFKWTLKGGRENHLAPGGHRCCISARTKSFARNRGIEESAPWRDCRRVLVVENDERFASYLYISLQQQSRIAGKIACVGCKAEWQVRKRQPQSVWFGLLLSGIDKSEIYRRHREAPNAVPNRMIAMNGYDIADAFVRIQCGGVGNCLVKPLTLDIPFRTIDGCSESIGKRCI
jgi:hypothetical protein